MLIKIHNEFQYFMDTIIPSSNSIETKITLIKSHLLTNQPQYEKMLFSCFQKEELEADQYFYITYTYHDQPINMDAQNEIVVSMLFDLENEFYFEITVFNYNNTHQEYTIRFNRTSDLLN